MALLSKLKFASCYVYNKRGTSQAVVQSRKLRDLIKAGNSEALERSADRVAELSRPGEIFADVFGPETVLVPVPGSAPRLEGALWVPERICEALARRGLARAVSPLLVRVHAVPKSAFAAAGERPTVEQHFASMRVDLQLDADTNFVLVDDVITKGRTMLAAASRLTNALPEASVIGFALLRYRGYVDELNGLLDPCLGTVLWHDGDAQRDP